MTRGQVRRCLKPLDILKAFQLAEALVKDNLPSIERVARALYQRGELTGADVRALMYRTMADAVRGA
jgi:hypothetical protein